MRDTSTNRAGEIITREDERQLLDTVQKWLDRDVRDKVLELEHADDYPHEMVEQMKALGLFGATIGQVYGGLGLPAGTYAKIVTAVSEIWMSLSGIFNSHLIMSAAVERFGTEEQKRTFLPRFATGELRLCRIAGKNGPRRPTPTQGNFPVHRRKGPWFHCGPKT